jgi:23S rRNA (adenine2030-N6)-methyltransferase
MLHIPSTLAAMNYRHAFHAGNFADCMKHALLARILLYLGQKATPFHVVDTHAGIGLYDLEGSEATRSPEWRDGIARLIAARAEGRLPRDAADLLAPYLDIVTSVNLEAGATAGSLSHYPGSPLIAQRLLRRGDRYSACELHPADKPLLEEALAGDRSTRVYELDGWLALKSFLPVKERRGLVLVDPPFEEPGEFQRLTNGLADGLQRFANGIYMLWYPVKDEREARAFRQHLATSGVRRILALELRVAPVEPGAGLTGTGVIVVNPPWTLAGEARTILPALTTALARSPRASWLVEELAGE